ncbi:MAG: hypothetical protein JST48_12400 [Bacteroidetes bacterium]|nr:hypothetical protein [Bacteroidota bacterium]
MVLLAVSCKYDDISPYSICLKGEIVLSTCCTGTTFINLETSIQLGKKITWANHEYQNMIQVPGYLGNPTINTIGKEVYLNLRAIDMKHDQNLFPTEICFCLIPIALDVPVYVAVNYSYGSCP